MIYNQQELTGLQHREAGKEMNGLFVLDTKVFC